jgi:hypothetical protein
MNNPQPWWLTWPPAEVAATILPYFSSRPYVEERDAMVDLLSWWRTGSYPKKSKIGWFTIQEKFTDPDARAVAEAMQVLEHAGLLLRHVRGGSTPPPGSDFGLTRLGMHALETNTVRQHLGLSDTPPPTA